MTVYDTSGRSYSLEETKLSGGEGKLYSVSGSPNLYPELFTRVGPA